MPWAVNQIIQNYGDGSAISALTTDGEQIFGTGWAFFGGGAIANFEGVFSADPMTGALNWIDGGRGDNYSITVTGDVVYTAGHPHDWGMLDFNPQYDPYQFQYSIAINKHRSPTLTNAYGTPDIWQPFMGRPAAQPLHWLPSLSLGTYTGQYQAGWSIASNDNYVVIGGEFPRVNGVAQQGLVRFAKRSVNPVADTIQGAAELKPTLTAQGPGTVRVAWTAPWDRDNQRLKVEVLRGANVATAAVIKTFQNDAHVVEPGAARLRRHHRAARLQPDLPGARHRPVRQRAHRARRPRSPFPAGTPPASPYSAAVLADNPDEPVAPRRRRAARSASTAPGRTT